MNISIYFPGAYVPVTMDGNIVVDGVLASCYAHVHHDLGHMATTPIRKIPRIIDWIFSKENEPTIYIKVIRELGRWAYHMQSHLQWIRWIAF